MFIWSDQLPNAVGTKWQKFIWPALVRPGLSITKCDLFWFGTKWDNFDLAPFVLAWSSNYQMAFVLVWYYPKLDQMSLGLIWVWTNVNSHTHAHILTYTHSHTQTHTQIIKFTYSHSNTHTHILTIKYSHSPTFTFR